jgi:hypothetical protein
MVDSLKGQGLPIVEVSILHSDAPHTPKDSTGRGIVFFFFTGENRLGLDMSWSDFYIYVRIKSLIFEAN